MCSEATCVVEQVPVQRAWMPLMAQKSYAIIKKLFSFTGSLNHSFASEIFVKSSPAVSSFLVVVLCVVIITCWWHVRLLMRIACLLNSSCTASSSWLSVTKVCQCWWCHGMFVEKIENCKIQASQVDFCGVKLTSKHRVTSSNWRAQVALFKLFSSLIDHKVLIWFPSQLLGSF